MRIHKYLFSDELLATVTLLQNQWLQKEREREREREREKRKLHSAHTLPPIKQILISSFKAWYPQCHMCTLEITENSKTTSICSKERLSSLAPHQETQICTPSNSHNWTDCPSVSQKKPKTKQKQKKHAVIIIQRIPWLPEIVHCPRISQSQKNKNKKKQSPDSLQCFAMTLTNRRSQTVTPRLRLTQEITITSHHKPHILLHHTSNERLLPLLPVVVVTHY